MTVPSLTYDFYRNAYKGSLGEGELDAPPRQGSSTACLNDW